MLNNTVNHRLNIGWQQQTVPKTIMGMYDLTLWASRWIHNSRLGTGCHWVMRERVEWEGADEGVWSFKCLEWISLAYFKLITQYNAVVMCRDIKT